MYISHHKHGSVLSLTFSLRLHWSYSTSTTNKKRNSWTSDDSNVDLLLHPEPHVASGGIQQEAPYQRHGALKASSTWNVWCRRSTVELRVLEW